ncbi:hypothetical protein QPK87_19690 [Kamptonema cortianum]|nr:hypothetical protein [Geitlerinema splendidum]MDK3158780.1 hypothetical protein [Kamptonema cortianum]
MSGLTKIFAVLTILCFAGMCFAPIEQKPPGAKFHEELSEAELSKLQGTVEGKGLGSGSQTPSDNVPMSSESENAAKVLAGSASEANKVLIDAGKESDEPPKKRGPNMLLAVLIVVLGVLAAYGYKSYFGKDDQ